MQSLPARAGSDIRPLKYISTLQELRYSQPTPSETLRQMRQGNLLLRQRFQFVAKTGHRQRTVIGPIAIFGRRRGALYAD